LKLETSNISILNKKNSNYGLNIIKTIDCFYILPRYSKEKPIQYILKIENFAKLMDFLNKLFIGIKNYNE
jgi:hypothetical protein